MKSRKIAILLVSGCIALLSGCGSPGASASSASALSEPEAFGTLEIASTPEYASEATGVPEEMVSAQEETPSPEAAVSETDLYEAAIAVAVRCQYGENLSYDPTDPMYFWRAMGYLIGSLGTEDSDITYEDGSYTVSQPHVAQLAYVLFGDFDGEIPSVTEEDPLVSLGEGDTYVIHLPELEELDLRCAAPEAQDDGSYTVTAEQYVDGTLYSSYTATLRDLDGLCAYCLVGLSETS